MEVEFKAILDQNFNVKMALFRKGINYGFLNDTGFERWTKIKYEMYLRRRKLNLV